MLRGEDFVGALQVLLLRPQSLAARLPAGAVVAAEQVVGVAVVVGWLVLEHVLVVADAGLLVLEPWHEADEQGQERREFHDHLHAFY